VKERGKNGIGIDPQFRTANPRLDGLMILKDAVCLK